jgi:hypothetical protein
MKHLEHPSRQDWEERRGWFESLNDVIIGEGSYLVSEQGCALIAEVQSVFCAGAWVAVVVLAMAVVDAQFREIEAPDFRGSTKELLNTVGADPQLQRLRLRRNALLHLDPENPAITCDQQWANRPGLESEARHAVRLMLEAFYASPGI